MESFVRLLGQGDLDGAAALFAAEIDWYVPGDQHLPWTGRRSHRPQFPEFFRTMWPVLVEGEREMAVYPVLVDGSDAVMVGLSRTP